MAHYNSYESFKTKKSIKKKEQAKNKSLVKTKDDFVVSKSSNYGIVLEVKYNDIFVIYENVVVKATLRKDLNEIANQVLFVGDKVELIKDDDKYIVKHLIKRNRVLSRTKKDSTKLDDIGKSGIIATNIDIAVIVVSCKEPPLHPKFIDRYLMILQNSNIPAIICLNKCDLKTLEEEKILDIYRKLNIIVIETSTYKMLGIDELKKYLKGKQAIFVGNSGVGKSSLTNALLSDDSIKTSSVSDKSKRGRHTTTSSKYYLWDNNSSIIDTPGIRSLDVSNFNPIEIQQYFLEFKNSNKCKYSDCLHFHEPINSCFIKQEVINGYININRYISYLRIMSDILNEEYIDILNEISKED